MTQPLAANRWEDVLPRLAEAAGALRSTADWPADQFRWLGEAGVLRWVIPQEFGGSAVSARELTAGYDRLATACLVTAFVLTQRNGACQRIAAAEENEDVRRELLPPLARGELFATVGISHLTTSRQHLDRPAVTVRESGGELILAGEVPWVTGAPHADFVVTGGTCADGRQMLMALPGDARGVRCAPPAELLALSASCTASLTLEEVRIPARYRLAGPVEGVMRRGTGGGTGSATTSALAIGLSERAVALLEAEAERRPELRDIAGPLRSELTALRTDLLDGAEPAAGMSRTCPPERLRERANSLVLRSTQAALAASKGAGFVQGHPVERMVREALFFLVWSCPQPVVAAALRQFACLAE